MEKIPVTFKLDGKEYTGTLDEIAGAGNRWWHLTVNDHYWGRLRLVNGEWHFDESNRKVSHLKDDFATLLIAWYQ